MLPSWNEYPTVLLQLALNAQALSLSQVGMLVVAHWEFQQSYWQLLYFCGSKLLVTWGDGWWMILWDPDHINSGLIWHIILNQSHRFPKALSPHVSLLHSDHIFFHCAFWASHTSLNQEIKRVLYWKVRELALRISPSFFSLNLSCNKMEWCGI